MVIQLSPKCSYSPHAIIFLNPKQVNGFNFVLSAMFPNTAGVNVLAAPNFAAIDSNNHYLIRASKLREVAKKGSEQMKAQAEQIYQTYSAKNWCLADYRFRDISSQVEFQ